MSSSAIMAIVFQGVCVGFGSAIGNYLALKYAIDHIDKIPSLKEKILKAKEALEK